ncbi:SDR family oxidoreductase [Rhodococcus rhodnii]|uniref:Short-chain dehydrogenase n=2 Tax=Rhodococcus rhodnii TaxID=38312 RepID=R7WH94_9NOCA|nr:SDR family oxidoreductase [Rhodococcus rhodnii]EOM74387.1 short-chain dehydrogenase [Rhodococcus rhodnii LMG 5362]TXG89107.1 SDR family oxidoreductase [Rhodococcus rhodnii]
MPFETTLPAGAALVFGGSGGIGRVVATEFAAAGSDVAVCYRSRPEIAEKTATDLRELGVAATIHRVDVRDADELAAAVDGAIAEHSRIHTLVWCAGPVVEQNSLADTSADDYRRSIEIESLGMFGAVHAVLPHMREHGGGSVVHVGSAGDRLFPPHDGLSVLPKAANEALVRGIAREEGRHGIRANSVLVGVVEAGMFLALRERGVLDEKWESATRAMLPLRRYGKAEDIAAACVFLASDRANYITGEQLSVAGGFGV